MTIFWESSISPSCFWIGILSPKTLHRTRRRLGQRVFWPSLQPAGCRVISWDGLGMKQRLSPSFMGSFMRYGKNMGYIELWTSISGCSWDLKTTKKRYNHGELNPHKLGHGPPYHYGYIMSYIIHLWLELHFHGVIMLKKGWLKNIVEDKPTIEWDWIPRLSFTTKIEGIQQ